MKTATFNGRQYRIIVDAVDGLADTDDHYWLLIGRDLQQRIGLETAIHEALHACSWRSTEQKVESTARDIARFLWNLGYRLKD